MGDGECANGFDSPQCQWGEACCREDVRSAAIGPLLPGNSEAETYRLTILTREEILHGALVKVAKTLVRDQPAIVDTVWLHDPCPETLLDYVETALKKAAQAKHGMDEWQPIETVPKDGSRIILSDGISVEQDRWIDWLHGGSSWDRFRYLKPTHWMPLPAAPSATSVDITTDKC